MNIINDDLLEDSETFRVSIYELSVPYGITLGSTTSATVTITDTDSEYLCNTFEVYILHITYIRILKITVL